MNLPATRISQAFTLVVAIFRGEIQPWSGLSRWSKCVLALWVAFAAWFTALPVIGLLSVARRHRWILVVASFAVVATAFAVPHLQQRINRFTEFDDPESMRRYDMWNIRKHLIAEDPFFGVGPSGVGVRYDELKRGMLVDDERRWVHLHNDPINIAAYHGFPAAMIWVMLGLSVYVLVARWIFLTPRAQRPPSLAVGAALAIHAISRCGFEGPKS